jgi:hypothetical protein
MLFYKHLCSFWKRYSCMYASILVQLSSFVHHFLFSLFLFAFFLFIGIFFSSLSIREKEKKASYYSCCLFSSLSLFFSLSRKYFLLLYIYTYISIRRSASAYAPFFFSLYWPNLAPTLLLSWCFYSLLYTCLRTRIECVYTYTRTKRNQRWYIYINERCTILYTYSLIFLLPILIY